MFVRSISKGNASLNLANGNGAQVYCGKRSVTGNADYQRSQTTINRFKVLFIVEQQDTENRRHSNFPYH